MRTVKLDKESIKILKAQKVAFRKKFGREPGPQDPVFFNPKSDVPEPMPLDYLKQQLGL